MWSTETYPRLHGRSGIVDVRAGHIKIELKRGIDIREFERLLRKIFYKEIDSD